MLRFFKHPKKYLYI